MHKCDLSYRYDRTDSKVKILNIGKRIRERRKELKMSVDELAKRVGKDRSTIYRYENGDIGNMPLELVAPMVEALKMTPHELLSFFVGKSEWLSKHSEAWFNETDCYEFSDKEVKLFNEIADYLIGIRNSDDYEEKINCLFTLFEQLNK